MVRVAIITTPTTPRLIRIGFCQTLGEVVKEASERGNNPGAHSKVGEGSVGGAGKISTTARCPITVIVRCPATTGFSRPIPTLSNPL